MNTKRFMSEFKELGKGERVDYIANHISELVDYMLSSDFKNNPYKQDLYGLLFTKKFAKAIKKYTKTYDAPAKLVSLIIDSIATVPSEEQADTRDIITIYVEILRTVLDKRVSRVMKVTGLPEYICYNVLLDCPETVDKEKTSVQFTYIKRVIRKLYIIGDLIDGECKDNIEACKKDKEAVTSTPTLLKLLREVLGNDVMEKVASFILLENAENRKICEDHSDIGLQMWDAISRCGVMLLNYSGSKKEVAEWIEKYYIRKRIKANDIEIGRHRRLVLSDISEQEAEKIYKAVLLLKTQNADNEKFIKCLD